MGMPTIRALRRKAKTPLERSATPPPPEPQYAPPEFGPPVDIDALPLKRGKGGRAAGLRYERERCYALAMGSRFFEWLCQIAARDCIPLDNCLIQIEETSLFVEACLLASATWPHLAPMQFVEEDEPEARPTTEAEAQLHGLSIVGPRKPGAYRPAPALPGCHGIALEGGECQNLRRFGEKFCPSCRRRERQRLRAARG